MKKSKPAVIHTGKPFVMRGWKLPCKWDLVSKRFFPDYQRMVTVHETREEALARVSELFLAGWEVCEVVERENLLPLLHKRSAA